ncbi:MULTISPECIES: sulfatase [unclassified Carboxylicivirga]|uniref:sulfatase n=1 Tax=Carboxylicivirga TaxID=1628153 RepID=UPI003D3312D8
MDKKRAFVKVVFVLLICWSLGASAQNKYNILFVAIDDLRPELNCYGESEIISPNIDKLAETGVVFKNAYCQQALCGPSRLSLMTGVHPDRLGVYGMSGSNPIEWRETRKGLTSLSEHLRNNGYYAIGFGKIYDNRLGLDKGYSWDSFDEGWRSMFKDPNNQAISQRINKAYKNGQQPIEKKPALECFEVNDDFYTDGSITKKAEQFLDTCQGDKPFFLAVGYNRPHLPFVAPKKYWDLYDREMISMPEVTQPPLGHTSYTLSPYKEIFDYDVKEPNNPEVARELRHGYFACVSYVDHLVGRLIKKLKEKDMLDNTIIVLWGDHGFKLGDYSEWAKATNLELDARVPLIIKVPQASNIGNASCSMVELVDLMPTLCELNGIDIPAQAEGVSLVPVLKGKRKTVRKFALSQFPRGKNVMGYSIRTEEWRYTRWVSRQNGELLEDELYQLNGSDKYERNNVVEQHPSIQKKLAKYIRKYRNNATVWQGETID